MLMASFKAEIEPQNAGFIFISRIYPCAAFAYNSYTDFPQLLLHCEQTKPPVKPMVVVKPQVV